MLIQSNAFNLPYRSGLVHAVLTSPPYWSMREYEDNERPGAVGLEPLFDCGAWRPHFPRFNLRISESPKTRGKVIKWIERVSEPHKVETCDECHVCHLIEVGREIWRVLRDDGTFWLNYADCFVSEHLTFLSNTIAQALTADGWMPRNDLIWYKPNAMPDPIAGWRWEMETCECGHRNPARGQDPSGTLTGDGRYSSGGGVGDIPWTVFDPDCEICDGTGIAGDLVFKPASWRHTRAHEFIFQLVKEPQYYANQEAVRVRSTWKGDNSEKAPSSWASHPGSHGNHHQDGRRSWSGIGKKHADMRDKDEDPSSMSPKRGVNPKSVLEIPTAGYSGAHFATFPEDLIAPLILASVPRRSCPECGAPWAPIVDRQVNNASARWEYTDGLGNLAIARTRARGSFSGGSSQIEGYKPTCEHDLEPIPGIVLDPFGGSGTTGLVAKKLLRRWIIQDISQPYLDEQAKLRTGSGTPSTAFDGLPLFEPRKEDV